MFLFKIDQAAGNNTTESNQTSVKTGTELSTDSYTILESKLLLFII